MADPPPTDSVKPDEHGHASAFGLLFGPDYVGTPASNEQFGEQNGQYGGARASNEQFVEQSEPQFGDEGAQNQTNGNGGISLIDQHNFLGREDGQTVENDINVGEPDVSWVVEKICKQSEQYLGNESSGVPAETNGAPHQANGNNLLEGADPGQSGEGLPYAPVDWPSPGDVWTWKVGRRLHSSGTFNDRFISPPKRLQKAGCRSFGSKVALEKYIRSEFPDADVNAFFASFTWKIPSKPLPPQEVGAVPLSVERPLDETMEKKEEEIYPSGRKKRKLATPAPTYAEEQKEKMPRSTPKREKGLSSTKKRNKLDTPASSSKPKRTPSSTSNRKTRHSLRQSVGSTADNEAHIIDDDEPADIPEDFDNYLNSLEDILAKPVSEDTVSQPVFADTSVTESQMAKARSKLSSLLEMDFPSLVLSKNVSKLTTLASQLRKDPTMSADQLVKLKLIEEIPLFSEVFMESRGIIEEVDKCYSGLEANKTRVNSLKSEYSEYKEKTDQLQAQIDSNALTVKEIDNQIAQLQAWRAELTDSMEKNKEAKSEIHSAQKVVANAIPGVVREIQVANSRIPEWDLKKTNALKREAEILEKFAPLRGFAL
ncbi:hypothetical protein Tsubulata_019936 [Turnera subulata]|uniref:DUF7081 domain-containing protein n=1 Tax=Turnera subulata TaxID=218843 RepID=A0A9Q0FES8_9ROSI|nr:hypothetical protein Tsubulata_019936 [Turnera subulata]